MPSNLIGGQVSRLDPAADREESHEDILYLGGTLPQTDRRVRAAGSGTRETPGGRISLSWCHSPWQPAAVFERRVHQKIAYQELGRWTPEGLPNSETSSLCKRRRPYWQAKVKRG